MYRTCPAGPGRLLAFCDMMTYTTIQGFHARRVRVRPTARLDDDLKAKGPGIDQARRPLLPAAGALISSADRRYRDEATRPGRLARQYAGGQDDVALSQAPISEVWKVAWHHAHY